MADDPLRPRPPSAPPPDWDQPLPDWARAAPQSGERGARAAPQSGERGEPGGDRWPFAAAGERPGGPTVPPGTPDPSPGDGGRGKALLRDRRVLAGGGAALLLVVGLVAFLVLRGGGDSGGGGGGGGGAGNGTAAGSSKPLTGKDLPLLDGRLVVAAQEGWQQLDSSTDSATVQVQLKDAGGRELLATMVTAALPGAGSVDTVLKAEGATRFEAGANGMQLPSAAVPDRGQVIAAAARPWGIVYLSLSVFALDGKGLDVPTLQKLFGEQVAPALRFP
jgi:hypothetical protein